MAEGNNRGYSIMRMYAFIQTYDEPERGRAMAKIPPDVLRAIREMQPAEWYSWDYPRALLSAVASVKSDEEAAYRDLVRCGEFIANEATNTFLKLLMRVLSPTLFVKKLPDIWARDMRGGRVQSDVSQADRGVITVTLSEVGGFDHIGAATVGFMSFALRSMGKKDIVVTQTGWSLRTPAPDTIAYRLHWS